MLTFNDIAIPISWPDQTARGDEKWMALLARVGIVKNLNFRIGHAAILLIARSTGSIVYFDFGRYLVPRGYGRARSAQFDPRLRIDTKAVFSAQGAIINLAEIFEELSIKEPATHGAGRTLFSICEEISFSEGQSYAEALVSAGPILYGALAKNNNSCSRFVAQILSAAMRPKDARRNKILYPESLKASPTSNVVNAAANRQIYCYYRSEMQHMAMGRGASFRFQIDLLKDNFSKTGAQKLGCDQVAGMVDYTERPDAVPPKAQWLGGIGEGAWFALHYLGASTYEISKYDRAGQQLYAQPMECSASFDIDAPFHFTWQFSFYKQTVSQGGQLFHFEVVPDIGILAPAQHNEYNAIP